MNKRKDKYKITDDKGNIIDTFYFKQTALVSIRKLRREFGGNLKIEEIKYGRT